MELWHGKHRAAQRHRGVREEEWSPSKRDQEFVNRFPEYVDSANRITVSEVLFKTNVELASAFVTWAGERLDLFVQLLTNPSAGCSPS